MTENRTHTIKASELSPHDIGYIISAVDGDGTEFAGKLIAFVREKEAATETVAETTTLSLVLKGIPDEPIELDADDSITVFEPYL